MMIRQSAEKAQVEFFAKVFAKKNSSTEIVGRASIVVIIIVDKDRDNDQDKDDHRRRSGQGSTDPAACSTRPLGRSLLGRTRRSYSSAGVALSVDEYGRRVRSTIMREAIGRAAASRRAEGEWMRNIQQ